MKASKFVLSVACMLILAMPVSSLARRLDPDPDTNRTDVSTSVSGSTAVTGLGAITDRISSANGFGGQSGSGLSSGNGPVGLGIWALGTGTSFDSSQRNAKFDGSLFTGLMGVDKQMGNLLFGVAVGVEALDLTTKYNSGNIANDGFSVIPYASYAIMKDLIVDASFGYTALNYTIKETQLGDKYSAHTSADRLVTSLGITKFYTLDKVLLSARLGTLYLNESMDGYDLGLLHYGHSGVHIWQGNLGLRATYDMGAFKPTAGLTYMQDFSRSGRSGDNWGTDLDLGFSYKVGNYYVVGLSGILGFREDMTKAGAMLNLRYDF